MKNLTKGLALLSILSLFSCTKVLYTHEQVVGLYKTKQDVMKTFGVPTEKKTADSTEEWLYRYDRHDSFRKHAVEEFHNAQAANVKDFNKYKRYLVFAFDRQGTVIRCDYEGVDLAVKKKDTAGTVVLIVAGVGVIAGITAYTMNHLFDNVNFNFN
jgi:hypothetical protein